MKTKKLTLSLMAACTVLSISAFAEEVTLDDITVVSDFREQNLTKVNPATSVLDESQLYDKSYSSLGEVISKLPNINYAAGASRAKYIQIRGIGERSQFETPINPSVGLIVDGVDMSNTPLGATLFDMHQIEVHRGPQGTEFGANALGGVVVLQSNEPTKKTQGHIEATAGNYNTKAVGAAIGGTLVEDKLLGRFSLYKNVSDGYYKNTFLHKKNTNNIDELSAKGKLKWFVSDDHTVDLTLMHIDIDNGYDAFNQNSDYNTESDQPGKDKQKSNAISIKSHYKPSSNFHLETSLSYNDTDTLYSYDEDWTDGWNYGQDSTDSYKRNSKEKDVDIRLISDNSKIFNGTTGWVVGAYWKKYDSDLYREYTWLNGIPFTNTYTTDTKAFYGELNTALNDKLSLVTGLRVERWKADYSDSDHTVLSSSETLVGGKVALKYSADAFTNYTFQLTKGYRPAGVNQSYMSNDKIGKLFKSENLWNLEAGVNHTSSDKKLTYKASVFYGKRKDHQVKGSISTASWRFTDYIANADKSSYYGLETELDYALTDDLNLYGSLGLLRSKFDDFYNPVNAQRKDGRSVASAPRYQYDIGLVYSVSESLRFKTDLEGKGSYYFSNSNDQKSKSYKLLNASLEYTSGNWSAILWGKNLTDEKVQTRGFYFDNFGNGDELYTQLGAPRTFGLTISYDF
ncbi:TonB-dependent receptor [hydrothermal vent metagenome]|uniref:TonB-dependent receptor n=1 Tax=hydrothermal vent metagenome TaxID=652676 RepID=A0A1W1BHW1_9ZZZZ